MTRQEYLIMLKGTHNKRWYVVALIEAGTFSNDKID